MEDYSSLYLCSVQYGSPKSQICTTGFNLIDFSILLKYVLFDSLTLSRYKQDKRINSTINGTLLGPTDSIEIFAEMCTALT